MEVITNGHKNIMGEMGASITSEDQINMDKPNDFTNKWGMYLISNLPVAITYLTSRID